MNSKKIVFNHHVQSLLSGVILVSHHGCRAANAPPIPNPLEPTQPDRPVDPIDPTDPGNPAKPIQPSDPIEPTHPQAHQKQPRQRGGSKIGEYNLLSDLRIFMVDKG